MESCIGWRMTESEYAEKCFQIKIRGIDERYVPLPACLCRVFSTHVTSNVVPVRLGGGINALDQELQVRNGVPGNRHFDGMLVELVAVTGSK